MFFFRAYHNEIVCLEFLLLTTTFLYKKIYVVAQEGEHEF